MKKILRSVFICLILLSNMFAQIPTDGLVAYYPFNGNANDLSGNNNDGTINGGCSWVSGRLGNSCSFNGSGYISIPNSVTLQSPSNSLSINFWMYIDSWTNNWAPILAKSNTSSSYGQYSVEIHKTAGANFWTGTNVSTFNSELSSGNWYNIAFTWDGANTKYYINGVLQQTKNYSGTIAKDNLPLEIGRHIPGSTNDYFKGKIDELCIYDRALNNDEILTIYNEGTGSESINEGLVAYYPFNGNANDESSLGNNGNPIGGITWTTNKNDSPISSCEFNGSDGYISVPNSSSLQLSDNKMSICLWFSCEKTYNGVVPLIGKNNSASNHPQYSFHLNPLTTIRFGINDLNNELRWSSPNYSFSLNNWYFLCVTWDGSTSKIYVNNELVSSTPLEYDMKIDEQPLEIGRDIGGNTEWFKGKIDELRIYNRALSQNEIQALFNIGGNVNRESITTVITHGYKHYPGDFVKWGYVSWLFAYADSVSDNRQILYIHKGKTYTTNLKTAEFTSLEDSYSIESLINEGKFYQLASIDSTKDIVIIFDWIIESFESAPGFLESAADAFTASLIDNCKKFPGMLEQLHFIGHSRGSVIISEVIERLLYMAENNLLPENVIIDKNMHMTTLDPHPAGHWSKATNELLNMKDDEVNSANINFGGKRIGVTGWKTNSTYKTEYIDNYFEIYGSTSATPFVWLEGLPDYPGCNYNIQLDDLFGFRPDYHGLATTWYYGTIIYNPSNDKFGKGVFIDRENWYKDSKGKTEGFYNSIQRNGDITLLNSDAASLFNINQDYNYQSQHLIFNGDFSKSESDIYWVTHDFHEIAGWSYQGGGGTGRIVNLNNGNNALLLGKYEFLLNDYYYPELTHNPFYIPTNVDKIWFRLQVANESSNDILKVEIGGIEKQISLSKLSAMYWDYINVSSLKGTVQKIKFSIVSSSANINSKVYIDDVSFIKTNLTRATVDCPVDFHIYDDFGNHTGPINDSTIVEEIPNSQYYIESDSTEDKFKTVFLPPLDSGEKYTFVIKSRDAISTFNFVIEDNNDSTIGTIIYQFDSIAINPLTKASCTLEKNEQISDLKVDQDGDGNIDRIYSPIIITDIRKEQNSELFIVNNTSLEQNYPNPFNPTTKISYSLSEQANVVLTVFDILGRKIKTLIDKIQTPGNYSAEWNANEFPSGVYIYKLQAGKFTQTKKMLLMK